MMKENIPHLRRQKDLVLRWKILTQGAELPLEGRDLQLEVTMPGGASHRIPCPDREGCSIVQRLSGRDLTRCGLYSLTLWENFGLAGQTAVDARHAFCLVPTTDDELLPSAPDIDSLSIDTVQIETASLDIPADMLSGLLERLTRAEQDINATERSITETQQRLAAMGVKQLGVFGSVQAGYDAAAEDAVCENEQIGIIMFSHGEPYHNNYVILQTVNRSHYITTQTMLMEGHSAKSWTRRIVLGGNKEVGPWRQVNGMVESFHLNGTRLMGRTPGEAEVQLVDLAPIIPQVPAQDFRMLSNTADDELTSLKSVRQVGYLGRFPIYEEVCMFRFYQPTFMRTYPTICASRISGRTVLARTARYRHIEYVGTKELPTAAEGSNLKPSDGDIPELVIVTPTEKIMNKVMDKEHDIIFDPTMQGETMERCLIWVTTRYVEVHEIIKEN